MSKPQILKKQHISIETQSGNGPQISKDGQISNENQITKKAKI
jgi:hypothetical protein